MIHVIGGVYRELCSWPQHDVLLGSAGRAALCLSQLDRELEVTLHARIARKDEGRLFEEFAFNESCELMISECEETTRFDYFHPLSEPLIYPEMKQGELPEFDISSYRIERALMFGMIEACPKVFADVVVYDPQNTYSPVLFSDTGSRAGRLAYVVNRNELSIFFRTAHGATASVEEMTKWLHENERAEVTVVKCGDQGAYIFSQSVAGWVSPYKTSSVFPIGSGDSFAAAFFYFWQIKSLSVLDAGRKASVAAAYYVSHRTMNNEDGLNVFGARVEALSAGDKVKRAYLAGPFFTLSELWMINETKSCIESFGVEVFSPYHELGIGAADEVVKKDIEAIKECDVLYAVFDGCDPGTLFEIGYARSLDKPVVILAQNPKAEELKMYEGSGCHIFSDFSSSIYNLSWL